MKIIIKTATFLLLAQTLVFSQNTGVGTWKSHLPNKIVTSIESVGDLIYAGGPLTFFTYNLDNSSLNYNSKFKGYSGSSISQVGYSKETNTIVIAYDDSNIDLIKGKTITKVSDIVKSGIVGSRTVNHLYFYRDKAYFSTNYGLLIYNLRNEQVEDVCKMFKAGNSNTQVGNSTILNDTIYITTTEGVYAAPVSDEVNKLDYRNWKEINTSALKLDSKFYFIASVDNRLYMANETRMEIFENGKFISDPLMNVTVPARNFQGLKNIDGKLWILQAYSIVCYQAGVYKFIANNANPVDITIDRYNQVWVADAEQGLLKVVNNTVEMVKTNGPYSNYAFQLYSYQNKMMILTGGYNFDFYGPIDGKARPYGFSILDNGIWNNYSFLLKNAPIAYDICAAKYNPISNKLFFASYGNGLLEWDLNNNGFKAMNHFTPGVPLNGSSTYRGDSAGTSSNRVPDIAMDNKGVMWILNTPDPNIGKPGLFKYDLAGKWDSVQWVGQDQWGSYNYSPLSTESFFLHKIFIDKNNNKWLASRFYSPIPSGDLGLFVYNEDKSPLPRHLRYEKDKANEICGKQVYCIIQDLDGAIWIGTENGVCFFPDPEEVFLKKPVKATTPLLNNLPLLKGKRITGIDFDGSNRKWISTATDGLILVSADGSKIIATFDETNSPLVTKFVNDVKVNRKSGEVFAATDDGVFSYNGFSVAGTEHNENVKAYPNPLKKDYTGYFTVDGLVNMAIVKITDISGKLVFESKAEGSRFTWNVKDYNGRRPDSGIYLIYSSKDDGTEHLLTKIAILD